MQMALDQISKTGPDQTKMVIPRRFGNPRFEDVELTEDDEQALMRQLMRKDGIDPDKVSDGGIFDKYRAMARKMLGEGTQKIDEGYEKMVMNALKDAGISHDGFRNGFLYIDRDDMKAARKAIKDADMDPPKMIAEGEDLEEGKMKDLMMHIEDMIRDGSSNVEIKKMHPMVSDSDIDSIRKDMDESVQETIEELPEADEVAESIAKMKAMAGVGSNMRSNHGIHEGEPGYQITPRSIVARQLRKLQDLEK